MSETEKDYVAYLLRLHCSDQDGQPIWRVSLESAHDARRLDFADLEALIAFLRARFDVPKQREKSEAKEVSKIAIHLA